ncbi:aryl-alcohol dehydrogenase [Delitschia confertaspora ATCC 74209]|uniref:Aryl-alcohol dehydrogenase n=1 Tax=Delitschia confertaspora ATCC 74209 TaxID=1513339 RepID=A0A9P4JKU0_9PLEO|nr:aryl-alcohol dehydrogenase [Delitschia confertaspora ATCC 74209]
MLTDALVNVEPGASFKLQKINVDENLHEDEVLIKTKATGVCHTDLNFSKEDSIPELFPGVFGHEGAGTIVSIGSAVKTLAPGDNVLISYTSCGNCSNCKSKATSFCKTWEEANFGVGRFPDGSKAYSSEDGKPITSHFFGQSSFSRYCVASERSVVKVPDDADLSLLAPLGCGIMTGAGAMLNVVKPAGKGTVVVVGAGAVGLAAIMAVKLLPEQDRPGTVVAVDIVASRLEMAKKYGATHVVNAEEEKDLKAALMKLTEDEGVDGSIDCTGIPEVVNALLEAAAKRGIIVTVGVGRLDATASPNIFKTVNSGRVYTGCCMGSCYPQEFIPMLIDASKRGDFPFTELIKTFPVADMDKAVCGVHDGTVIKAVLTWE